MASIIQRSTDDHGNYLPLHGRINIIGCLESLPLHVLDDQVPRKHPKIRSGETTQKHMASDTNRRNGVLVTGHKIQKETLLDERDIIRIAKLELHCANQDFDDTENALHPCKKVSERARPTTIQ